jgi:hypothetical protein
MLWRKLKHWSRFEDKTWAVSGIKEKEWRERI